MKEQDPRPQQQNRARIQERITEIRRDLVVGEACAGTAPEVWNVAEEELLDELAELELSLLSREPGPYIRRRLPTGR